MRQDNTRLQSENAQLHVAVIKNQESQAQGDKDSYQQVKRLEDRIAELQFWRATALDKIQSTEKENLALKGKVDELVRLTDQLTAGWSLPVVSCMG